MRNNKPAGVMLSLIIITALVVAAGFFLPKSFTKMLTKPFSSLGGGNKSGSFGQLNRNGNVNKIPNVLRWKKSFSYTKKKEKRKGSYIHYLTNKNKK